MSTAPDPRCRIGKVTPKSNVVPIWSGINHSIPVTPPGVLDLAERVLRRAQRGELTCLAVAAMTAGNASFYAFDDGRAHPVAAIGSVRVLEAHMIDRWNHYHTASDPRIGEPPDEGA